MALLCITSAAAQSLSSTGKGSQGASHRVRLYGYVLDEQNRGIEACNVYWKESVATTAVGTSTNKNGYYELIVESRKSKDESGQPDSVTIVYSMLGYETVETPLPLPSQKGGNTIQVLNINIILRESGEQLAEVEVTGIQRQQDMMDRVDATTRRVIPDISGGGIESLLITFAGVSQTNEMSSQYNVRGGSFDENAVYVNGIEIHRPLLVRAGQQEGLSFVNPEMVQNVQFSAGGFDARFGDKSSSVLDIRYKQPTAFEASLTAGFQGGSVYVGVGDSTYSQMHGIRYKSSQYMLGSLQTKGNYRPHFLDYQTYMTWRLAPSRPSPKGAGDWTIALLANYSMNSYGFTPDSMSSSFGTMQTARNLTIYYDGQEQDLFQTAFAALSVGGHVSPEVKIGFDLSGFYTNERETYDIQGEYILSDHPMDGSDAGVSGTGQVVSSETTETATVLGKGTYHEHARNTLTAGVATLQHTGEWKHSANSMRWGVSGQIEKITDRISEWEWRDSAGYSMPHTEKGMELYYAMRSSANLLSGRVQAYLQDSYTWHTEAAKVILTGGARLHWWSFNNEVLVSPRASVVIIPGWKRDISFRIATGLYYQAPFYKEMRDTVTINGLTRAVLNENIKSQRSLQFIAAMDYRFKMLNRPFKFSAEAYFKALSNLIPYNVQNVKITYFGENICSGYAAGLDLKLYGEFVPGTDSWLTFSLMSMKQKYNGQWIPTPTDQRYAINLHFTDYFPGTDRWKMTLRLAFADGLPFGPPHRGLEQQQFRAPAYKRADIGMSYRALKNGKSVKNIWLGLDCLNLFGISNVNSYYWVTDVTNRQWAVPNYLTGRQINGKVTVEL